jgi:hypothetical protein
MRDAEGRKRSKRRDAVDRTRYDPVRVAECPTRDVAPSPRERRRQIDCSIPAPRPRGQDEREAGMSVDNGRWHRCQIDARDPSEIISPGAHLVTCNLCPYLATLLVTLFMSRGLFQYGVRYGKRYGLACSSDKRQRCPVCVPARPCHRDEDAPYQGRAYGDRAGLSVKAARPGG